jgi:hypothetical protein
MMRRIGLISIGPAAPRTDGVDHADHLVPRDARVGDPGPLALLGHRVAVADAAGLDTDAHLTPSRLGH